MYDLCIRILAVFIDNHFSNCCRVHSSDESLTQVNGGSQWQRTVLVPASVSSPEAQHIAMPVRPRVLASIPSANLDTNSEASHPPSFQWRNNLTDSRAGAHSTLESELEEATQPSTASMSNLESFIPHRVKTEVNRSYHSASKVLAAPLVSRLKSRALLLCQQPEGRLQQSDMAHLDQLLASGRSTEGAALPSYQKCSTVIARHMAPGRGPVERHVSQGTEVEGSSGQVQEDARAVAAKACGSSGKSVSPCWHEVTIQVFSDNETKNQVIRIIILLSLHRELLMLVLIFD